MQINLTLAIIAVTCLVSILAFNNAKLLDRLLFWPPAVARRHQYDRLLTHGFVHADGAHLLFNMITLYFFGGLVERLFTPYIGGVGYVLFYLSAIVVAIIPTWLKHKRDANYRSLGASGAVSAVLFCFILVQPWSIIYVFVIPVPAIIYAVLYVGYTIWANKRGGDNVNHSAHLSGAAYGVLFFCLLEPRVIPTFFARLLSP